MEELNAIHAEMVTNKWSVQETAANNSVKKFDKWQTLYMAFRRNSMDTNVKKNKETAAV